MRAHRDVLSFKLKLSALTPFTVGSGRTLNRFDFTLTMNPRSGAPLIRVLDVERFIDEGKTTPEKKVEAIEKRQSGTLDRFTRYILACQFREAQESIELLEFNRDADGKPLVPASSLRGMLRTAVAFASLKGEGGAGALREGIEGAMEGRWKREGAAQKLERRVFWRSQEDVLKALRIAEPQAVSNDDIKAYEVSVLNLTGSGLTTKMSLCLEAVNPRSGAAFEYEIAVDRALLGGRAGDEKAGGGPEGAGSAGGSSPAGPGSHLDGREKLLAALRGLSEALIDGERRFYFEASARELSRRFDDSLKPAEGRIALPFGFGAGWRSKTVGVLLGPGELTRLAPLLSPGRSYYRRGPRPIFPKTRRWVLEHGRPVEPLGWVAIE